MSTTIKLKRGTAAAWTSSNRTLADGEVGYETNTGRLKIGDGLTPWNSLAYTAEPTGGRIVEVGVVTLIGGTGVVLNENITADSLVFISSMNSAGGQYESRDARVPGVSFTVLGNEDEEIAWMIVEPN